MSAPGSLACSKILYPETEQSQLVNVEDLELPKGEETNMLESVSNGAVMAVQLVVAIIANLIVFLALLALLNSVLGWMGELLFLGYLFFPLAFVMGVTNPGETFIVAQSMGTKTALNEFVAYKQLGQLVKQDKLSPRSAMIATYALCGFSNFTSIGIQLGTLGGMVPSRKRLLSQLALRSLLAGCISCFLTASLAGVLIDQPILCRPQNEKEHCFDVNKFI
uniref:Concentrative nucleoside transporter C-terminal domain-containing protein n=1 Tax=Meloidogyne enterolobii TaxID=390850 RepID=A0A6V7TLW7_MELEN|nr:unnamed protein product [Meloidogyne enterolobii]